jgi:hypothetical protein
MPSPGVWRNRLTSTLNEAYADGLISEQTLVARLDQVLNAPLLEPHRLIGDLSLSRRGQRLRDRLLGTLNTAISTLTDLVDEDRGALPPILLGLDWSAPDGELTLGRSSRSHLVVGEATVSRHHARLIRRDGAWVLQDLASKNGTFVNGRRVGRCRVLPGDRVTLGVTVLRID